MRTATLLLASICLSGQVYRASDDGSIVYFSSALSSLDPKRQVLWISRYGEISPVRDNVQLSALSRDGATALVWEDGRYQILRDRAPILSFEKETTVLMSPDGRRFVAISPTGGRRIESSGASTPLGPHSFRLDASVPMALYDDGTLVAPCPDAGSCVWRGTGGATIFYWNNGPSNVEPQRLVRVDAATGTRTETAIECAKKYEVYRSPSGLTVFAGYIATGRIESVDPAGQRVRASCLDQSRVYSVFGGSFTVVPPDVVLDYSLTRVLTRPAPFRFLWAPLSAAPTSIAQHEFIQLTGPLNARGVLAYRGEPDFTITWGGQPLPWLRGAHGYAYAPVPRDVVEGAIDSVVITVPDRPWLNHTAQITIAPPAPAALPLLADEPEILFIHEDYRGFLTPNSPALRGEILHFLISGIDAAAIRSAGPLYATYSLPANAPGGLRPPLTLTLPVLAVTPTDYHPSITQVTVQLPETGLPSLSGYTGASLVLPFMLTNGQTLNLRTWGVLRY